VFEQIRDAGLLVSEYPPGTAPPTGAFLPGTA
jgi:predicted Rossmann fold nucleotide-binding protein DprA/Smf involved in DNA uptake